MRRALTLALLAALAVPACSDDRAPSASPSPSATTTTGPTGSPGPTAPTGATTGPPRSTPPAVDGAPRLVQIGRFESPVHVAAPAGDRRVFVVEKAGRIRVFENDAVLDRPFLDIADDVDTTAERGLLSLVFAPDYPTSGRAYVNYTANDGDVTVAEFTVSRDDPNRLDPASRRILLEIPHPKSTHNGGLLAFDSAGMLLLSVGDGGGANDPDDNGQDLGTLLGKVLRIDPRRPADGRQYGIPADNPFLGVAGARPEVWAYGVRNPWRYALGPDGAMYLGDVGQYQVEEINVVPAAGRGANFGWPAYEGRSRTRKPRLNPAGTLVQPVHTYRHSNGRCAVTAGFAYRGRLARLRGRYVFADFCDGQVLALAADGTGAPQPVGPRTVQLASFGEDGFGELFVASLAGPVYKIAV